MQGIGEFFANLIKSAYQGLYNATNYFFTGMTETMNRGIIEASTVVTANPQNWNATAFSFVQGVAENAFIPVAACILTFIFCLEVIHLVQESNQLHNIKPETMLLLMLKLGICLFVCSKSFTIVNGFFDVASEVSAKIGEAAIEEEGPSSTLEKLGVFEELSEYSLGDVFKMLGNLLFTMIAQVIICALTVAIMLKVNLWYLELLVYASAAPIPFSTFINKEWGQVGNNYIRKMLAVAFEGAFMLVIFGLYTALTRNALSAVPGSSDNYLMSMVKVCGCGVALFLMLGKAGNISASIFNAH